MVQHKVFTIATDVAVYFCEPQSQWQRGTNENTNGLLCQYFPTGTDLSTYTQADLDAIALKLNARPRKNLCPSDGRSYTCCPRCIDRLNALRPALKNRRYLARQNRDSH